MVNSNTNTEQQELRIGIIGCGMIAASHMSGYSKAPGVQVVACCDIEPPKVDAFAERWGIKDKYLDYRELIARDDIDAVSICVHNNLHAPLSVAAMRAGLHVYCEKPIAGSMLMQRRCAKFLRKQAKSCISNWGEFTRPRPMRQKI